MKITFISGVGFFTDAYDLFIVTTLITLFLHTDVLGFSDYLRGPEGAFWLSVLTSSAIWTAIAGQLIFGGISDKKGRKSVYGIEAMILTIGAIASALSQNLLQLIIARIFLGFGIGGDYPISSVIASEYSNVKDRGKMIALVFSNQGIGILTALGVSLLSALYLPPTLAWRVMVGIAAIPASIVIYLRRKMPETPRYSLLVKGDIEEVKRAGKLFNVKIEDTDNSPIMEKELSAKEFIKSFWLTLLGTTLPWFILDVALYGTGLYSDFMTSSLMPTIKSTIIFNELRAGIPYIIGLPGYFAAVAVIDRLGRKTQQILGFISMALIYTITVAILPLQSSLPSFLLIGIYSLSFFFINFGPNTTTFIIPAEVYPVIYRSRGHGISSASGKLGAALTTYLFPTLEVIMGTRMILMMLAVLSLFGAIVTAFALEETKMKSLEQVSGDAKLLVIAENVRNE